MEDQRAHDHVERGGAERQGLGISLQEEDAGRRVQLCPGAREHAAVGVEAGKMRGGMARGQGGEERACPAPDVQDRLVPVKRQCGLDPLHEGTSESEGRVKPVIERGQDVEGQPRGERHPATLVIPARGEDLRPEEGMENV